MKLTKYRLQILTWAFYHHKGEYALTMKVNSGSLYARAAEALVTAGLLTLEKITTLRQGSTVSRIYTYKITNAGRELLTP